jgi:ABC-type bacteriocin/lantibiotic exporter with double-glycine peptidase domain
LEAGVLPPLAQDPPADDSPSQAWIRDWVDFLTEMLPLILPVVVILIGIVLIFKAKSGIGQVIIFGIGAALVFLLLTNLETVANFFGNELPFEEELPSSQGD